MIFADSSVWIDYFNGTVNQHTDFLDAVLGTKGICLGDYVLVEVLQGFKDDRSYEKARISLLKLPVFSIAGPQIAIKSAENYRILCKKGITIRKTIDVIIATFCINRNFELLHKDRDFFSMEKHIGLKSCITQENW